MDCTELRSAIPAVEEHVYLNTARRSPSPTQVVDAVTDCTKHQQYTDPISNEATPDLFERFDSSRTAIARFLGASPAEIALTNSTADGVTRIANAIPWQGGDTVVRTDCAHAAGVLPWKRLQDTDRIDVETIGTDRGTLEGDALADALAGARLLCLSSITRNFGTRIPISEVVEIARENDTLVLVDAVQSIGQTDVDVHEWNADFVVGSGHKWLLGPWGAGFLYIREGIEETLQPRRVSYRSVEDQHAEDYRLKRGARRLEVGTASPAPHAGLRVAIELLEGIGVDTIERRIERLTDHLKEAVDNRILSPTAYESGIVTFADDDPEETAAKLTENDVHVRALPAHDALRVSVHAFNTTRDIETLLSVL